ncbi:MAG TPA: MFS transporter [Acidimicrobiales bacterium]|nr:MFS transporter [Acidimicrobiales bacterium]
MSVRERLSPKHLTNGAPLFPLFLLFGLNVADELDRTAFAVLIPEIRDHFGLDNTGILTIIALVSVLAYGLQPIIGYYADRGSRVRIAVLGAAAWAVFSFGTGLATTVLMLTLTRAGSAIAKLVNTPTHHALLSDYYAPGTRPRVFGFYGAANSVGFILGPLAGGFLARYFGWRAPFLVFAIPTAVLVMLALLKLREPVRGELERRAMGAEEEIALTEEEPPSFGESWRICYQVKTLRRIWLSVPFLFGAFLGLGSLTSIFYEDIFNLDEAARGLVDAVVQPFGLIGIAVGIPIADRLFKRDEGLVLKMLSVAGIIVAACLVVFALAPNVGVAIGANIVATAILGVLGPGMVASMSLTIPPRARAMGFSIASLYVLPGALVLVVIGGVADSLGIRVGMLVLVPIFLVGAFILASAGSFVRSDIQKVQTSTVAQAAVLAGRRRGEVKLLLVKDLDVAYDSVQVLFGIDFEVDEGEIVALLGTNGAGKSTLLKAISGLVDASAGAVIFDGRDMTYAPPHEVAARGVVQVPGGKGVFPSLTVAENIRIAGWLFQRDSAYLEQATQQVLEFFPVLRERWDQAAGSLSGGEQQMLTLAQAFIAKPRLLMIDELSLGLAPVIVAQLLEIVRAIREQGTTIILVEQSVNVALTVAQTAYFMEKGEIRFHGPTAELLSRPDVLRSVFLEGAGSVTSPAPSRNGRARTTSVEATVTREFGPTILEVRNIAKSYQGVTAVADVSFELRTGQILGIIGPNGAGKTTVFDLVSGFVPADTGAVFLDGTNITDLLPDERARLGLGRSFQDARLFPGLTVAETIAVSFEREVEVRDPLAAFLGTPALADSEARVREKVDDLIELMGLGAFRDKFVSELSTGSRRIVDLACVVAQRPKVMLFDEPSSGIAQRETEALGPLLLKIRDEVGASLIVIEHDMPLITSISDEIVALDLGRNLVTGPPNEVVRDPRVVASYLGSDESVIARSGTLVGAGGRRERRRNR